MNEDTIISICALRETKIHLTKKQTKLQTGRTTLASGIGVKWSFLHPKIVHFGINPAGLPPRVEAELASPSTYTVTEGRLHPASFPVTAVLSSSLPSAVQQG